MSHSVKKTYLEEKPDYTSDEHVNSFFLRLQTAVTCF